MKKAIVILLLSLVPLSLEAGEIQTDLNGFRLWQFKKVTTDALGQPFDTFETETSTFQAHRISDEAYMIFGYLKDLPNNIFSIQLTGYTNKVLPFKELIPGDDIEKVNKVLGKPAHIEKIDSPNVSKYEYEGTNYTVEIDDKGKLYSIRIYSTKDLIQKTDDKFKSWDEFKAAIIAKDIKRTISMLRPDVEIYKNGKVISINQRYADFVENPDKELVAAILGDKDSVLKEVAQIEPEAELRLIMNFGVGEVYKFYKGEILKELVFFPYNGRYRVYEIRFREQ